MRRVLGLSVLILILAAGGALAQTTSSTTGAIDGKVTDTSNAVLPGVTVTIASEAMMGTRDTVTTGTGTFRFVSITPGDYAVTFELPGFATVKRDAVHVGAGFTATLNISMNVAGLEEAVTVTGASPVVDTQATKVSTNFDSQKLAALPSGSGDPWAILAETPGVKMNRIDVGGSTAGTQTTFTSYGTGGQRPYYEGINGTEGTSSNGNYVDIASFDEVAVNAIGNNAEMGPPGVMMVFVSKTGGNTYHGAGAANYQNRNWQATNIDAAQIKAGVQGGVGGSLAPEDTNKLYAYRDDSVQLGGYIKKDKLWWFGAYRDVDTEVRQSNFPVKPFVTLLKTYTVKSTYQLTQNNKLIGYYMYNTKGQPNRLDRSTLSATNAIHLTDRSQFNQHYGVRLWKGEFNSVLSDSLFVEVRAGQWGYNWTDTNESGVGLPSYEDTSSRIVSGAARHQFSDPRRNQVLGSLSYFKQGWGGSHNFKLGWEIFRETGTTGSFVDSYNSVLHVLRNGAPLEVYLFGFPQNATAGLWNEGFFVTDQWRMNNFLSINIGMRFDRYQNFLSAQSHPADRFFPTEQQFAAVSNVRTWNVPAPRFGLSYNVTGDGKTVVKANWGWYWNNPGTSSSNPNGSWQKRYSWTDTNKDLLWQSGEETRLISSSGGIATTSLDPNEKDPYTLDMSVWLERELIPNLGLRAGYVHRVQKQFEGTINTNQPYEAFSIPVTIKDPGPDGVVGNGDDGAPISAMNLAAAYVGLPTVSVVTNVPGSSKYDTYEFAMTKRPSKGWSAQASYSWTKSWGYRGGGASTTYPYNPNSLINANGQGQDETTDYSFKLNGSFDLPAGVKMSPVYRFQAGNNFGRQFVAAGLNYANPTINAEPLNAERTKNINVFDLRIDRGFTFAKGYRLAPFVDIYNLSNTNPTQDISITSGSSYLRPINIVAPRIMRIGAKLDW